MEETGKIAAGVLGKMIDQKEKDGFDYYLIEPEIRIRESCLGKEKEEDGGMQA